MTRRELDLLIEALRDVVQHRAKRWTQEAEKAINAAVCAGLMHRADEAEQIDKAIERLHATLRSAVEP